MKIRIFLLAAVSLLISVMAVSAQDTAKPGDTAKPSDFTGKWVLDVGKSKLDERAQTDKELKTTSDVKRTPPPNGMTPGGGRGGFGGGPDTHTFSLDGKETSEEGAATGGMPAPVVKLKAELKKDGTLSLQTSRKFTGAMGEVEITTKETWALSADGKTLTIDRDQTTPRGSSTSKLVLTKSS
jgi:opacity protein-like surface antigen